MANAPVVDESAVAQNHDLVGQVLDLGEQVAGDEDRAAGCGTIPQQVAKPADALRVEPVAGFVEHQDGWVTQQRGGDAESLPHAEGVGAHAAVGRAAQVHGLEHRVDAREGIPAPSARIRRWLRPLRPGWKAFGSRTTPTVRGRILEVAVSGARDGACPRSAEARSSRIFIVVDFPAPLGPRKPVTRPGATVKVRSSTTTSWP